MERPGKGKDGTPVKLTVNYLPVHFLDQNLWIVHYVVQFEPPLPSNYVGRRFKSLLQEKYFKEFVAYDGNENLYIAQQTAELQEELGGTGPVRFRVCPWYRGRVHEMSLKIINVVFISDLMDFCSGDRSVEVPKDCLQALDAVVRDSASWVCWPLGKYIYRSSPENNFLEMGLQQRNPSSGLKDSIWCLRGFYESLCAVENGLAINLDSSAMAFHGRICVSHYLQGRGIELAMLLRDEETLRRAKKYLVGLNVDCPHQLHARMYKIVGISHKPAKDRELFDWTCQRETSIAESFQKMFSTIPIDPSLPYLILAAPGRESYYLDDSGPVLVPMDACLICSGQLFNGELAGREEEELQVMRGSTASERLQAIMKGCADLRSLLHREASIDNKYIRPIDSFRLIVGDALVRTAGRVIEQPALWNVPTTHPVGGSWQLTKVYKSGRALSPQQWGILVFCSTTDSGEMKGLVDRIIEHGQAMGVQCFGRVQEETIYKTLHISLLEMPDKLCRSVRELKSGALRDIVFLFCIADDTKEGSPSPQLGSLARLCEADLGWLTKCCYGRHLVEAAACDQQLTTMALMINAKLGGTNTALRQDFGTIFRSVFVEEPVILFGTDVPLANSHLRKLADVAGNDADTRQRGRTRPAGINATAVVASMDWPHPSQYCARVIHYSDPNLAEVPWQTSTAIEELVDVYAKKNGDRRPKKAVFFRHCAGDVEPWTSPKADIKALRKAVRSRCPGMRATWVDVRRNHHTRLFRQDDNGVADVVNVEPGTVVDSGVVHPRQWDFYLASHPTTKPTYYRVVRDENKFTADDMQKFVYYLCHTFAAPTLTTETVPPLYYAKLAAGYSTWTRSTAAGFPTGEVNDAMYFLN